MNSAHLHADAASASTTAEPSAGLPAVVDPCPLRLLPYQAAAVASAARFTWNNWSRQTGKSFAFTLRRVLRGLARRRNQVLLSAGARQSRELMLKVRAHCSALAIACELRAPRGHFADARYGATEARLPNGVRIIALPANPFTARGFTADVLLDEFAMHRDDRAIWAALFPTLLRGSGELDIASTPRGRGNMFHRLGENSEFTRSTVTLKDAIAAGLDADANALRAAMNDETLFRQEFMCEFDHDDDAFLRHETIVGCVDPALSALPDEAVLRDRSAELFAGMDIGRTRDLTVIWLWQRVGDLFVTVGVIELAGAPFDQQRSAIEAVLAHRSVRRLCVDATGIGRPLAEELVQRHGDYRVEAVTFTATVQSQLAARLKAFAEERRIRIPSDELIHNDWHALKRRANATGHIRLQASHGPTGHADRFWAAALGLHACDDTSAAAPDFSFDKPLRFAGHGAW